MEKPTIPDRVRILYETTGFSFRTLGEKLGISHTMVQNYVIGRPTRIQNTTKIVLELALKKLEQEYDITHE